MEKKSLAKNNNKKTLIIVGAVLLAIAAAVLIIVLNRKDSYRNVTVNDQSGTIELRRNQSTMEITKDMRLIPDDFVSVGDKSLLDLLVDDDKHIAVRSSTKFSVNAVGNPESGLVTIHVTEGKSYIKIDNPLNTKDGFQVVTPNATISVRGTTFTVYYDPVIGLTRVECVEGKVNVASNSGEEIDLSDGEAVDVIDVMTTSTLTQQEVDAIVNVFTGGDGTVDTESEVVENAQTDAGNPEDVGDILNCMTAEEILQAKVGDVVTYGTYGITYRDYEWNDEGVTEISRNSDPETGIEWIVLENDGKYVTLLSRYNLDYMPYDYEFAPVTWENSDIRAWLNDEFYHTAFTETEQNHIQTTFCINESNPAFGEGGPYGFYEPEDEFFPVRGNDTQDKVYLLSLAEIEQYFGVGLSDYARQWNGEFDLQEYYEHCNEKSGGALATENPAAKESISQGVGFWWLRSSGYEARWIAHITSEGGVEFYGDSVSNPKGVRPVIRIGL